MTPLTVALACVLAVAALAGLAQAVAAARGLVQRLAARRALAERCLRCGGRRASDTRDACRSCEIVSVLRRVDPLPGLARPWPATRQDGAVGARTGETRAEVHG